MRKNRFSRLLLLGGLLLALVWLGIKAFRIGSDLLALRDLQYRAQTLLDDGGNRGLMSLPPDEVEALVYDVRRHVGSLAAESRPFARLATLFGWVPVYGPVFGNAPALLDAADAGTEAATYLATGLKPILVQLQQETGSGDRLADITLALRDAEPFVIQAERDVREAATALSRIDDVTAFPEPIRALLAPAIELAPIGAEGMALLRHIPELAGHDGPRTYLILVQNADEARATGGFISAYGILRMENGQITQLDFADAYTVDDLSLSESFLDPPPELQRFMGLPYLFFRDANHWPDFPTSAAAAQRVFAINVPDAPEFSGTIAVDQWFLQQIVAAVGPLSVPGVERRINGNNVIEVIQTAWGTGEGNTVTGEWFRERKDIIGDMTVALQSKLLNNPGSYDATALLNAIIDAAEQKHLLVTIDDPEVAPILDALNWDGRIETPDDKDFLLALDTNTGFNKANFVVDRELVYQVRLATDGTATAALDVRYKHKRPIASGCQHVIPYRGTLSYDDLFDVCYYNFLRIYTPPGVELTNASSHPAPADYFWFGEPWTGRATTVSTRDTTVISNFFIVERGSELVSSYRYTVPDVVTQGADGTWAYSVVVTKQAGSQAQSLNLEIYLPQGAELIEATPAPSRVDSHRVGWDLVLDRDIQLAVQFHR